LALLELHVLSDTVITSHLWLFDTVQSRVLWYQYVILAFRRLGLEDPRLQASLGYIVRPQVNEPKEKKKKKRWLVQIRMWYKIHTRF
jgi:hypothetical protein